MNPFLRDLWCEVFCAEDRAEEWRLLDEIAQELIRMGDYEAAILTAQRMASQQAWCPEPCLLVAEAYLLGGFPRAALKMLFDAFERSQTMGPDLRARQLCALCFCELGWAREAAQVAAESLQYFPGDGLLEKVLKDQTMACQVRS